MNSSAEDTIFSRVYDIVSTINTGLPHWPEGIAGRVYNNGFVREWHGRENDLVQNVGEAMEAVSEAEVRDDRDVRASYMGESAAFVDSVRPAVDVLRSVCEEAEAHLGNLAARVGS